MIIPSTRKEQRLFWIEQISLWKHSGLSRNEYARRNGFNLKRFYRWCRRLESEKFSPVNKSSRPSAISFGLADRKDPVKFVEVSNSLTARKVSLDRSVENLSLFVGRQFRISIPQNFSARTLKKLVRTLEPLR